MTIDVHTAADGRTTTNLTGPIADEAALMGVLDRLYTHGAKLLALERLDWTTGVNDAPNPANTIR